MSFGDFNSAAEMRDVIQKIVRAEIKRLRPESRVARVISVNRDQLTAEVTFAGDEGSLNARFGLSLIPKGEGDLVRVAGKPGDYYITEILNGTGAHADYEPIWEAVEDGTIPSGPGGVTEEHIEDAVVDKINLGAGPVNGDRIEEGSISHVHLGTGAVTAEELAEGAVRSINIFGGAVGPGALALQFRERLESNTLGLKLNYIDFNSANAGEVYFHGFAEDGTAADVDGFFFFRGTRYAVPKAAVVHTDTAVVSRGYYLYDAAGVLSARTGANAIAQNAGYSTKMVPVRYNNDTGGWQYDNNATWVNFTPLSSDLLIGSYSQNSNLVTATLWSDPVPAVELPSVPISAGGVSRVSIQDGAVNVDKLAAGSVTAGKLAIIMGGGNQLKFSSLTQYQGVWGSSAGTGVFKTTAPFPVTGRARNNAGMVEFTAQGYAYVTQTVSLTPGVYTASVWVRGAAAGTTSVNGAGVAIEGSTIVPTVAPAEDVTVRYTSLGVTWQRSYQTFTVGATGNVTFILTNSYGSSSTGTIYLTHPQLEEGNVATTWAPMVDEIMPGSIIGTMMDVDAVSTRELAADAVEAVNIKAGAVTSAKLTIASVGDNIILNGNFRDLNTDNTPVGWGKEQAATAITSAVFSNDTYLQITTPASGTIGSVHQTLDTGRIPASIGDQFHVSVGASSVNSGHAWHFIMHCYDRAGAGIVAVTSSPDFVTVNSTSLPSSARKEAVLAVPNNPAVAYVRFGVRPVTNGQTYYFDKYVVGKVTVSARIADGAINTDKLASGAVITNKLAVVMGGGNLFKNSSFQADSNGDNLADDWLSYNNSVNLEPHTLSRPAGRVGGVAQRMTWSVANSSTKGFIQELSTTMLRNEWYTLSLYARASLSSPTNLQLAWNNGPSELVAVNNPVLSSTVWQRYIFRYRWTGAATVDPNVHITLTVGTGGTGWLEFDDAQLEQGDVVTAWNPRVEELLPGTIKAAHIDTAALVVGGTGSAITFAPGYDPSSKVDAVDLDGFITDEELDALALSAHLEDNYLPNPFFDKWPNASGAPEGYMVNEGTPIRETAAEHLRTTPYSLRFNVGAGSHHYIQSTVNPISGSVPFITVRLDVKLISGTWNGSGVLVRWYNTAGTFYDAVINLRDILADKTYNADGSVASVTQKPVGVWYRVQTVVPRPSGFSGSPGAVYIFPMGGWTGFEGVTVKEIVFDQFAARPSTSDEVKAWTAGLWTFPGTTKINGGLLQTGTVIADYVQATAINALSDITGPTIRTAASGTRMQMRNDSNGGILESFSGSTQEQKPGYFNPGYVPDASGNDRGFINIVSPKMKLDGSGYGQIQILSQDRNGYNPGYIDINSTGAGSSVTVRATTSARLATTTFSSGTVATVHSGLVRLTTQNGYSGSNMILSGPVEVHATKLDIEYAPLYEGNAPYIPLGAIIMWHGTGDPSNPNWLPCDGRSCAGTDYATYYGVTTVPNFQGRFPFGRWVGGGYDTGAYGGTLGPSHGHSITTSSEPGHQHSAGSLTAASFSDRASGTGNRAGPNISGDTGLAGGHSHGGSASSTTLPYYAVAFLIRVNY